MSKCKPLNFATPDAFALWLREQLLLTDQSAAEFVRYSGISESQVSRYLNGYIDMRLSTAIMMQDAMERFVKRHA